MSHPPTNKHLAGRSEPQGHQAQDRLVGEGHTLKPRGYCAFSAVPASLLVASPDGTSGLHAGGSPPLGSYLLQRFS